MPVTTRLRRFATVATAITAALLMSATSASATTNSAPLCGGVVRLTVVDASGTDKVKVTEYVNPEGDNDVYGVRRGFTWRNERTGATGSVSIGNEAPGTGIWSREWVVTTGRGNVVVTWEYLVSTSNCIGDGTLRAQAIAQ